MAKTRKNRRSPQRGTQSGVTKVNKTKTSKRPRASLARKAKERGSTYSRHLVNLQLHPDSYSKILGLLKTFLEKGANRDYFAAGAQLRTLALSCLAAFGSEIWGDDRANIAEKHKKHGLHFPEDQDRLVKLMTRLFSHMHNVLYHQAPVPIDRECKPAVQAEDEIPDQAEPPEEGEFRLHENPASKLDSDNQLTVEANPLAKEEEIHVDHNPALKPDSEEASAGEAKPLAEEQVSKVDHDPFPEVDNEGPPTNLETVPVSDEHVPAVAAFGKETVADGDQQLQPPAPDQPARLPSHVYLHFTIQRRDGTAVQQYTVEAVTMTAEFRNFFDQSLDLCERNGWLSPQERLTIDHFIFCLGDSHSLREIGYNSQESWPGFLDLVKSCYSLLRGALPIIIVSFRVGAIEDEAEDEESLLGHDFNSFVVSGEYLLDGEFSGPG